MFGLPHGAASRCRLALAASKMRLLHQFPSLVNAHCDCRTDEYDLWSLFDFGWLLYLFANFPWAYVIAGSWGVGIGSSFAVAWWLRVWRWPGIAFRWIVPRASCEGRRWRFPNNFHINCTIDVAGVNSHAHGHPYLAERRKRLRRAAADALAGLEGGETPLTARSINVFGGPANFDGAVRGQWDHYQVKSAYNTRDLAGARRFNDYDTLCNTVYSSGGRERVFVWDAAWYLSADQVAKLAAKREFVVMNLRRSDAGIVHNPFSGRVESEITYSGGAMSERVVGGDYYHHPMVYMPTRDCFSASHSLHGVRRVFQFRKAKVNITLRGDAFAPGNVDNTVYEDVWCVAEVDHQLADFRLADIFPPEIKSAGISLVLNDTGVVTHAVRRRMTTEGPVVNNVSDKTFASVQSAVASCHYGIYFENSMRQRAAQMNCSDLNIEEIVELGLQLRDYNILGDAGRVEGWYGALKRRCWHFVGTVMRTFMYIKRPVVLSYRARTSWAADQNLSGRVSQAAGDAVDRASGDGAGSDSADGGGPRRSVSSGRDPQPSPPAEARAGPGVSTDGAASSDVRRVRFEPDNRHPPAGGGRGRGRGGQVAANRVPRRTPPPPAAARHTVPNVPAVAAVAGPQAAGASPAAAASSARRSSPAEPAAAASVRPSGGPAARSTVVGVV